MLVDVAGGQLNVSITGSGPPLLLITGLGADGEVWAPYVNTLAANVTCVHYDQRGTGQSTRADRPYSVAQLATDAAQILVSLDLGPAHVCGVSMGGAVAMQLAGSRPELVKSLALHSTWARTDKRLAAIFDYRRLLLLEAGPAAMQQYINLWAWGALTWETGIHSGAPSIDRVVSHARAWDTEERGSYLSHLAAAIAHDCIDTLATVQSPTLVSVGDDDILTPRTYAQLVADGIPQSRLVHVPRAGHALFLEYRDWFIDQTIVWIEETRVL